MAYYDPLTGRKINYRTADVIRAEAPAARQRYFAEKELGLQEKSLEQNAQQFNEQIALRQEALRQQAEQAEQAQNIASLGLAKEAIPRAYGGAKKLLRFATGSEDKGEQAITDAFAPEYTSTEAEDIIASGPQLGEGEAVMPFNEQPINDLYDSIYQTPEITNAFESDPYYSGVGEAASVPGYEAGVAAVNNLYTPAYTTPAVEALAAEGAASVAPGVGEAAIPAVSGGQAAGEVGATAGSSAAEGTSFASGLGTAALMYAPYGLFKAFQKNKPSLRSYWPYMTHEQKLELIKTDPEYVARSGVVGGLGLYRESSVRNLGSGLGTPDAADPSVRLSGIDAADAVNSSVAPWSLDTNSMPFQRNNNLGTVQDVFGEKYDLGGKPLSFNTLKSK